MMASLRFFFIMASAMALATTLAFSDTNINEENLTRTSSSDEVSSEEYESSPVIGTSRLLLAQSRTQANMTCNRFPRICRAKGSPGPDCCKKKCVNVMKDNLNCGQCGYGCRYGTTCCGGKCVNVMLDASNCGSCKNRCKKGSFCSHGMCNYA